jgi:FdrA protein
MRFSRALVDLDGIEEATLMMGTPSNKDIMQKAGVLMEEGRDAEGGDLVIGIRAESEDAAQTALAKAERLLDQPAAGSGSASEDRWHAHTLRAALKQHPDANLALISVAGDFAASEARKAIYSGLDVMIFSDNVPLAAEIALKREAEAMGRLVMGPDCGTAIINGVALAFANKVRPGAIGIIGASGTGTQEISCLISQQGYGISQAIGVGGRDLNEEVGGISTMMAIDLLDQDPNTSHVVIVSKPPALAVARRVLERVAQSAKPFTLCFLGAEDTEIPQNATLARTLTQAADAACGVDKHSAFDPAKHRLDLPSGKTQVRGLFSGGTLCAEAQVVFCEAGEIVASNVPVPGALGLENAGEAAHRFLDLGADEYTRGRPHPMIDPAIRNEALAEALSEDRVGLLLVDVVIGYGAHADPAGQLVDHLASYDLSGRRVIASVTGTDADPQNRSAQVKRLTDAGVSVAASNEQAARLALACIDRSGAVRHL